MWLDNASQDLVNLFWQSYGREEQFPRNLELPLAFALPVTLVKLPKLQLRNIESWFRRRTVSFTFNCQSRAIRGCLIAFRGKGIIFLDGTDTDDEKRFTLAHEIAHFMVDYWQPRQNAIDKFGSQISDVIDGLRYPTIAERIHAVLGSAPIGVHTDLMERDKRLDDISGTLWSIEDRADRIALELLAPPSVVLKQADLSSNIYSVRHSVIYNLLRTKFGLPAEVAKSFSKDLLIAYGKGPSWLETIGLR